MPGRREVWCRFLSRSCPSLDGAHPSHSTHEMYRPEHHTMNHQDRTGDSQADSAADGRWLTFAELSQLRGISKTAAMKLVSRHGWRRQKNNKGQVRALVPLAW